MSSGTPLYRRGNTVYPRRQVENEIEDNTKATKNSDLDWANLPRLRSFFNNNFLCNVSLLKNTGNTALEKETNAKYAELYKKMFNLDNARAILLDLAKEYMENEKLAEAADNQYGEGCAEYTTQAIRRYYGEL